MYEKFPGGGGLENRSEITLRLPDLDNASVGRMETTRTPVIPESFYLYPHKMMYWLRPKFYRKLCDLWRMELRKAVRFPLAIKERQPEMVDCTGFEPVTSALSKQRSGPTELTSRDVKFKGILFYLIFLMLRNIRKQFKP